MKSAKLLTAELKRKGVTYAKLVGGIPRMSIE